MRRTLPILASILLGALAVALGMGLYLKKANEDRERLADIARRAQDQVEQIKAEGKQAIDQANKKIAAADAEVAKAQAQMKQMEEERELLAQATALLPPSGKALKGWKDAINLPLGFSLKYPPQSEIDTNDAQSLTLTASEQTVTSLTDDRRWFSLTPYDERLERELSLNLTSSTRVSYAVQGTLLIGVRGVIPGKTGLFTILRIQSNGKNTHLLWAKEPIPGNTKLPLTDVLATFDFQH